MKTTLLSLLTVVSVLGLTACESMTHRAPSPTDKAPGTYTTQTKSTNANGTAVSTEQKTHVYKDSNGNKKAVVETQKTTDPKGLFNKQTTSTTKTFN